ncbi:MULTISPECIES: thiolase family protein [unclassified Mycolicibacterium]|uniref:thiolase family protein n=1 Tax=unclassified Mycolicibacterium TaxID=2636767 RepID=UPI0012DC4195|nr:MULTISPECIES: thiolase family protein [unclassified Mycolicibacterium]MUL82323.1 thiolase family protein [Mycolicibacterium sp. CBMA 329]MUL88089.1 thiolase family protein [Mycolicibacterium sp. CBMA 331]MUM02419.1 thiolase family protein [Mycolicibacterium sp. CBMA 334]MUM24822.1 thiolase family protein [Mycolicibacterium sp. CBMA 295]MUM38386.1 thiolase family protein [Mycolicibacterium sp. CBMA 247]
MTELGRVFERSATSLAAEAVRTAVTDAGLALHDLDGLLVSSGIKQDVGVGLAAVLGLSDLSVLSQVNAFGATAGAMVAQAAQAIGAGLATTIACVFADTPLKPDRSAGTSWQAPKSRGTTLRGLAGWSIASGAVNPNILYALCAQRHMQQYGTASRQLAEIAVAQRAWAAGNPLAQHRTRLTVAEHQESRWIAEPLHLLDCCLVSNGAIAVVVTSAERAATLARPPVHLWGYGQAHAPRKMYRGSEWGLVTPAVRSGPQALQMAGITIDEVDVAELYDCYTYTVLVTLEDYGFCAKGEGGDYVMGGTLAPGGTLACNTGGGQLSAYYMWGMTPLSEAIIQARGDGGERQAPRNDILLVSGNGGIFEHHSTLVLSPHRRRKAAA